MRSTRPSEPGRGSTFTLYLPLHPSELPPQGYPQLRAGQRRTAGAEPHGPSEGAEATAGARRSGARARRHRRRQAQRTRGAAGLFRRRRGPSGAVAGSRAADGRPGGRRNGGRRHGSRPGSRSQRRAEDGWAAQDLVAPEPVCGFHGEKVLIVDDDIRNVFALTSVLEQHGLPVLYAENGREGIEVLEQHDDVTVVLMDIMMPEMDGYATTTAIRRMPQFAGLPIIALTAKAMKGDREKASSPAPPTMSPSRSTPIICCR